MQTLPLLVEPSELDTQLDAPELRIVELTAEAFFHQHHIPGSVFADYQRLILNQPPVTGLLPDADDFAALLSELDITEHTHVVACDNEGNGRASRFLWTLLAFGHKRVSLLNGGSNGWVYGGNPTVSGFQPRTPLTTLYPCQRHEEYIADKQYILDNLDNPNVIIVDTRTPPEFEGVDIRANQGGHIPGAINLNWTRTMDVAHNKRIKPESDLGELLAPLGITPDKEIIVYCHTHHRSSHTFMVLKSLGFPQVRGYPGSWSDWGNDTSTPKARGA